MICKKLVLRILVLSFICTNNFYSSIVNASNIEYDRYQTVEGEHIKITDSISGTLNEIEIFGKSKQDTGNSNFFNTQFVGDLYVDNDGEPILDKYGKNQYIVDIVSSNKNLFDEAWLGGKLLHTTTGDFLTDSRYVATDFIKVTSGQSYKFNKNVNVLLYNKDKKYLGEKDGYLGAIEAGNVFNIGNAEYIRMYKYADGKENAILCYSSESLEYVKKEEKHVEIILPIQLKKVGDTADKLYWDKSKSRYVIEKNVGEIFLDGGEDEGWVLSRGLHSEEYDHFRVVLDELDVEDGMPGHRQPLLSDRFIASNLNWDKGPHNSITTSSTDRCQIGMTFYMYYYQTLDDFKNWLNENPTTIWYQLKTPKIINTNITSKIKVPIYDETTDIYFENNVGILKLLTDRLPQIATESVQEAQSRQTIESVALARMYVNQLPESSRKDQLQDILNQIFSEEMELEKQTVSSNFDIYVKSENMLSMSLDTNLIIFENYSGVEDMELLNAVNISVNSSLPYDLNVYLPKEITSVDNSKKIDYEVLNIRESKSDVYKIFTGINEKLTLQENCSKGNFKNHSIDIKLATTNALEADIYKTVLQFEIEQR